MAYKITCYFTDEDIYATNIYVSGDLTMLVHTGHYGDDYYVQESVNGTATFVANPESGCKFTRWVYRVGSVTATVRYSYDSTFEYSGGQDIYIRAEGEVEEEVITRPDYFDWTYTKKSGGSFNLTANEWNRLTANINAVRSYLGYFEHEFTTAYSGDTFTAAMYNEAVWGFQGISGYGDTLSTVSAGDYITADLLNDLVDELNSIP